MDLFPCFEYGASRSVHEAGFFGDCIFTWSAIGLGLRALLVIEGFV